MTTLAELKGRTTPMNGDSARDQRLARVSERWLRLLLRLYPVDFRDEMGEALVETYRDRCRNALRHRGMGALAGVWMQSLADSTRNGIGERLRPSVDWRRGGDWGRDVERAVRRLLRAPLFTLSMLVTLAVGLGAFAMVAAVVKNVLLAPLPYDRPGDLYYVWRDYTKMFDLKRGSLAGTDIAALGSAGGAIQEMVGLDQSRVTLSQASGTGETAPEEIAVLFTTPNLFRVLGVRPALGRDFAPEETGPGRPALIVLGHDLWQRRFGGNPAIVGSDVLLNGVKFQVIGVMGRGFRFLVHGGIGEAAPSDAYVTPTVDLAKTDPGAGSYVGMLRARPGTSPEAMNAAVAAVSQMVDKRDFNGRGIRLYPTGLESDLLNPVRPPLMVLGAAGVLLVLVLGVNMASLLLVRASQREREFAISRALGANRVAMLRATLMEAGLLGILGSVLGTLLAFWGVRALASLAPMNLPRRESIAVDWQTAALVLAVGTTLGLLAGAVPATWSTRAPLATLLRNAAVRGGGFGSLRRAMVVAQVALSLVLLSAGGLVVRSFERLLRADPGFNPAGLLTLRVPVPGARYPDAAAQRAVHERLERELAAIPGVESVGATTALPFGGEANQTGVTFPGAPGNTGDKERDQPLVDFMMARAGYFETLGFRTLAGRTFEPTRPGGVREAVIDQALADRFYPGRSAVGAKLLFDDDTVFVVGVVAHARMYDVHKDGRFQLFLRNDDYTENTLNWALRTGDLPSDLVPAVRAAVARVDPQLALANVQSMEEAVSAALQQPRLVAVLLAAFSLGALLLAAMGLYGVVAGSVSRRRHEMAVRLALGAEHGQVLRLVLGEGARLVGLGLLIGIPGIWFASRLIGSVLVGVSPFDAPTLAAVAVGLAAVAAVACYIPARRVAGIDPAASLQEG
ncbi:MAG: ADOP family duplicated permease [Gemmatimonadota bacterium]